MRMWLGVAQPLLGSPSQQFHCLCISLAVELHTGQRCLLSSCLFHCLGGFCMHSYHAYCCCVLCKLLFAHLQIMCYSFIKTSCPLGFLCAKHYLVSNDDLFKCVKTWHLKGVQGSDWVGICELLVKVSFWRFILLVMHRGSTGKWDIRAERGSVDGVREGKLFKYLN